MTLTSDDDILIRFTILGVDDALFNESVSELLYAKAFHTSFAFIDKINNQTQENVELQAIDWDDSVWNYADGYESFFLNKNNESFGRTDFWYKLENLTLGGSLGNRDLFQYIDFNFAPWSVFQGENWANSNIIKGVIEYYLVFNKNI